MIIQTIRVELLANRIRHSLKSDSSAIASGWFLALLMGLGFALYTSFALADTRTETASEATQLTDENFDLFDQLTSANDVPPVCGCYGGPKYSCSPDLFVCRDRKGSHTKLESTRCGCKEVRNDAGGTCEWYRQPGETFSCSQNVAPAADCGAIRIEYKVDYWSMSGPNDGNCDLAGEYSGRECEVKEGACILNANLRRDVEANIRKQEGADLLKCEVDKDWVVKGMRPGIISAASPGLTLTDGDCSSQKEGKCEGGVCSLGVTKARLTENGKFDCEIDYAAPSVEEAYSQASARVAGVRAPSLGAYYAQMPYAKPRCGGLAQPRK